MGKRVINISIGMALVAVFTGVVFWQSHKENTPPGLLLASGRIEGRITTVTPKVAGRVTEIAFDEGENVNVSAILAVLEDKALSERVRSAKENLDALGHQLNQAEIELEVRRKQLPLHISQAESALEEASARVDKSRAECQQAKLDLQRYEELIKKNLVSSQTTETAKLRATAGESSLLETQASQTRAEEQLALSRLGELEVKAQTAAVDTLFCQNSQARAALSEQESYVTELIIISPLKGTVLTRNIELGEWVNPGSPLFTLVNLEQLYLKVYVPEPDIGKLALGQEARVYVDAYPDRSFPAHLSKVANQAEFTPKMVETRDERVKLVFAVELRLQGNPGGVLKPGMPADAVIRWQEDAAWVMPRS